MNKAGTWYLVAVTQSDHIAVFRAGNVTSVQILDEPARPPARPPAARLRPPRVLGAVVTGVPSQPAATAGQDPGIAPSHRRSRQQMSTARRSPNSDSDTSFARSSSPASSGR
ncbi:MAG: WYL domain-containing protein [Streptosporangiaceae bacterium]